MDASEQENVLVDGSKEIKTARKSVGWMRQIFIPIGVYHMSASLFMPFIQSLVYKQVCEAQWSSLNGSDCSVSRHRDPVVLANANYIMFMGNVALSVCSALSSVVVGRIGDVKCRRLALLIPIVGLLTSDVILLLQTFDVLGKNSVYLFIVCEAVFGLFGGYVGLLSSSLAYVSSQHSQPVHRSKAIGRLEAANATGSVAGFLVSSQLSLLGYSNIAALLTVLHLICGIALLSLPQLPPSKSRSKELKQSMRAAVSSSCSLQLLIIAIVVAYFASIGTTHILFFYLKYMFSWDAKYYGYLRASIKAGSTIAILFIHPFLKNRAVGDVTIAVGGLVSRLAAKLTYALARSTPSVFIAVPFEAFSRFAAVGIRSLIAHNCTQQNQGRVFGVVAVLESSASLLSALLFHSLLPYSALSDRPQLPFYLISALLIIPIVIIWTNKVHLEEGYETKKKSDHLVPPLNNEESSI